MAPNGAAQARRAGAKRRFCLHGESSVANLEARETSGRKALVFVSRQCLAARGLQS